MNDVEAYLKETHQKQANDEEAALLKADDGAGSHPRGVGGMWVARGRWGVGVSDSPKPACAFMADRLNITSTLAGNSAALGTP